MEEIYSKKAGTKEIISYGIISMITLITLIQFSSCISAGTHGSVKSYRYAISKARLETAVRRVISDNHLIVQDTVKDYYNDDTNYVTIKVIADKLFYTYTLRYYGGKDYWDTSKTSEIFIDYAHDPDGNGGSTGNGGIKWYEFRKNKKLLEPFERAFIIKIDSVLKLKHTDR